MNEEMKFIFFKSAIKDFREFGRYEAYNISEAIVFIDLIHALQDIPDYSMKYKCCPLGEFWLFEKKI